VVIEQPDRGHNWLGVAGDPAGSARRLKLVDHAYAFGVQSGFASVFYDQHRGQQISEEHKRALECVADQASTQLHDLLGPEAANVAQRAGALLTRGTLDR
jgi:hypothetical protein